MSNTPDVKTIAVELLVPVLGRPDLKIEDQSARGIARFVTALYEELVNTLDPPKEGSNRPKSQVRSEGYGVKW